MSSVRSSLRVRCWSGRYSRTPIYYGKVRQDFCQYVAQVSFSRTLYVRTLGRDFKWELV